PSCSSRARVTFSPPQARTRTDVATPSSNETSSEWVQPMSSSEKTPCGQGQRQLRASAASVKTALIPDAARISEYSSITLFFAATTSASCFGGGAFREGSCPLSRQ